MNKHVILLSAAVVLLLSCSREADHNLIQPGETITFTAAWAGSEDTRTILQADGTSVWWEPEAQINVFFSDKASGKFTSTNSQAQSIVDFQGSLPIVVGSVETENPPHAYWAVYPYDAANTCDGESVTLTVPSTQTAVEGTFANKMFPSIATSANFYLAFYNICGGVRFSVANEGIASVTFKANNGESLAGKVKVGFDGVPIVKSVVEGTSEVVVNAPEGGFVPGKYYFTALLPQTLTKGVSLTFKKADGKVATTSLDNSITINRSRFGKVDEKDKGLFGNNPTDIIVFADEKVKTRLVARFDTNGDGELSYGEAAAVTSIDGAITIKTVTSFDEFQYFTGVTSISDECFKDWAKLTSIVLPPNLISIGKGSFGGCSSLVSINIPAEVTYIGSEAFSGCSSLASINIPDGIQLIEQKTFYDCSSLVTISLPNSVVSIGGTAFYGCTSLTNISISESVTSIGASAFRDCTSLASVFIPDSVTSIGYCAFTGCPSLITVVVDSKNTFYDSRSNCNAIIRTDSNTLLFGCKNTIIPDSVTKIGEFAFEKCAALYNIIIPSHVTSIGEHAFDGCTGLTSISIPDGVTTIERSAFYGCSSLASVTIPESVTSIKDNTFTNCSSLLSVILPESVTTIERSAFYGCSSLTSVTIPESVTSIGESSFGGCTSLQRITLPSSLTRVKARAFSGCSSLLSITVMPENPPQGETSMFDNTKNCPIYVPSGSVDAYKTAFFWKDYASRIQAIPSVGAPTGYALVWSDEFDVAGQPSSEWWYETGGGGWGNNEEQVYVAGSYDGNNLAFISNGSLKIKAQKIGSTVYSIRMNTQRAWQYGWFEARIKVSDVPGAWPAFWMMPKNFTAWPKDGEIDIMEYAVSTQGKDKSSSSIHCNAYNWMKGTQKTHVQVVPGAATEFHVYAMEWTASEMKFYVDGELHLTFKNDGKGYDSWPFDAPFYLKFNMAWGGSMGGTLDDNQLPAVYEVDYVRVYQKG